MKEILRSQAIEDLVKDAIGNATDNVLYIAFKYGLIGYESVSTEELTKQYNVSFASDPTSQEFRIIDDVIYH